jgi:hypothetical protein
MRPLLLATILLAPLLVLAQNAAEETPVDANAQCSQNDRDKITSCLDTVEKDEGKLSTGYCSSSDWKCE